MTNQTPFTLKIFVANGDPDGLRFVDRSNWNGRAVVFPRAVYRDVRIREEFQQAGVYLLLGPRADAEGEILYVGEGDPVGPRLNEHYANRDFWTRAVFFVGGPGQLNKAHVQFLESRLVARAKSAKRMLLDNGNIPAEPTLSEADRADMTVFLDNILGILPVLGIHAFEQSPVSLSQGQATLLHCQGKGVTATGYDTPQGFVVKANSFASADEAPSLKAYFPNISKLRAELRTNGVVVFDENRLRFTQDYTFNSPSQASSVVLGNSSNGRADWKDANGCTLKQLQESETQQLNS